MYVPVVSFCLFVDIVVKVHVKLAQAGIAKVSHIVKQNFWHPALNKIIRDVCVTCKQCQKYKTHQQPFCPPVLRIKVECPYDLEALDLQQFPRTHQGNVALLVAIDHCPKFLMCVLIRDTTAKTVPAAYKASLNGCVERCNWTIIQL